MSRTEEPAHGMRAFDQSVEMPHSSFDAIQRLLSDAQAQAIERQRLTAAGLQERFRAIQDSLQNLLTLFHEEQRALVAEFERETAARLAALAAENDRMLDAAFAEAKRRAGDLPVRDLPREADNRPELLNGHSPTPIRPQLAPKPGVPATIAFPAFKPEMAPPLHLENPASWPGRNDEPVSPVVPLAGPALAVEARRGREPATARMVIAPFSNFTGLIRFESALKQIDAIRRFRSRNFRGGRFEVAFEYDPDVNIVEAILQIPEHRLELVSANDDSYLFRILNEGESPSQPGDSRFASAR